MPIQSLSPGALRAGAAVLTSLLAFALPAAGQHHPAHAEGADAHPLHFSHPMIGESVSPGSEARLEHSREGGSGTTELSLGYAPTRGFGLGLGLPVTVLPDGETRIGSPHLGLHFARFDLAHRGILLGYGVELSPRLPGASEDEEAEHAHAAVQPFLSLGYKAGALELIGSASFGLGPRGDGGEDAHAHAHAEAEAHGPAEPAGHGAPGGFGYNLSALHAISPRVDALLELYGTGPGEAGALRAAPGVRFRLHPGLSLGLGVSAALGATHRDAARTAISATYHW